MSREQQKPNPNSKSSFNRNPLVLAIHRDGRRRIGEALTDWREFEGENYEKVNAIIEQVRLEGRVLLSMRNQD